MPPSARPSRCPAGWGSCPRAAPSAWPSSTTPTPSGWGLSSFVSVGNKADISANDLLSYWEQDERTGLVLLYLESFGNPRKFARVARRVARTKPVLAVKSGRSAAGARATSSHTGAMLAASDVTVDALFHQAGVIRTESLAELFGVASLLANQPLPAGRRVGIVTNAGGPGIMCADCEAGGLGRPALPRAPGQPGRGPARESGGRQPGRHAGLGPTRTLPPDSRDADRVRGGRRRHRHLHPAPARQPRGGRRSGPGRGRRGRTGAGAERDDVGRRAAGGRGRGRAAASPPVRAAARALVWAVEYATWRQRPEGHVPALPGTRHEEAAALLAAALADGPAPRWLAPDEVSRLLACYGLPVAEWRLAGSPEEAGAAAAALGGPVALKAVAPRLVHKTEAKAVRLGLAGADEVRTAAAEMAEAVAAEGYTVDGFLVQRMVGEEWSCWSASSTTPRSVP